MKKIQVLQLGIFLLLFPSHGYAQYPQNTVALSTVTSSGEIQACQSILLEPGFSFTANSRQNLVLKIDPDICSAPLHAPPALSASWNYIIKVRPLDKTTQTSINGIVNEVPALITIQYFDGLGRPTQSVQQGAGGQGQDLVMELEYDGFGREWKNYLPVPVASNNGAYVDSLPNLAPTAYTSDPRPYSETVYEPSPLNRIIRQYGPGQAWNPNTDGTGGHPVSTDYLTNNNTDDYLKCARYSVSGNNLTRKCLVLKIRRLRGDPEPVIILSFITLAPIKSAFF